MEKIALVIPYYNDNENLIKSIRSINEDNILFSIDIILINDGSKNEIKIDSLNFYQYGKIYHINLEENRGVSFARNAGLEFAEKEKYSLTAFLDAGDYCQPNRFKKQVEYLLNHTDVKLLGCQVEFADENLSKLYKTNLPCIYKDVKNLFYNNIQVYLPAAIMRTDVINEIGYFPTSYKISTDFGFFFKIVEKFKTENIDECLVTCVAYTKGISSQKRKEQVKTRIRVIIKHFYFGFYPIYGLIRNILLLLISRKFSDKLKKILNNR